jgi:non-ribosomal peptide synthetase component F
VRFGVTSSGRVWGLPAYHRMVGMFITTLPRRVPVPADRTVLALMRGIQADAARSQEAEQIALVDLERDAGGRLFDSIVVVDNFPQDAGQHALGALLRRGHPFATDHLDLGMTEFPLRLEVIPMNGLHVALCHHRDQYGGEDAELLVGRWLDLLTAIAKRPEATIGELL